MYNDLPVQTFSTKLLVPPVGFKPTADSVETNCSIQLSYGGKGVAAMPHRNNLLHGVTNLLLPLPLICLFNQAVNHLWVVLTN